MRAALDGVTTVFLTSAAESANRVSEHYAAVDAAAAAGVRRIVYLSFLGAAPEATFTFARDHWHTEQRIRASGLAWTFLRDSIYLDFLPPMVALSMAAVAEQISQVSGRAARYQEESLEEAYASRAAYGQPRWVLDGWVTTYTAVARGELALVSDTVARVAGHPALTLIDFLRAHPESYAHLPTTV
jgi:NAD(P)H dehydrogenase (quinone)